MPTELPFNDADYLKQVKLFKRHGMTLSQLLACIPDDGEDLRDQRRTPDQLRGCIASLWENTDA